VQHINRKFVTENRKDFVNKLQTEL